MYIDRIFHATESKEGKPYKTKMGKTFTICTIKSNDEQYKFMDFYGTAASWTDGMELDLDKYGLEIVEKEWQGKKQKELQKKTAASDLEKRVAELEKAMKVVVAQLKSKKDELPFLVEEPIRSEEDLPF